MKPKKTAPYTAFLIFNFTFFMMDTVSGYFTIYLNEIGLSKTAIGGITAAASMMALAFQPSLGLLADRVPSKNRLLQWIILATALTYPLILVSNSVLYIWLTYTFYIVLRRIQPSLNNSMSLEYAETSGRRYGPIRMMGAAGYSLMMALIGQVSKLGTRATFYAYSLICLMNILLIFLLPPIRGHQSAQGRVPLKLVLRNRPVIKLIVFSMIMSVAQGFYFSFFSIYFTQELGGTGALYGTMLSVAALCEIPFLFYADRLIRKIGTKRMLFLITLLDAARWYATFFIKSPYPQMAVQSLNFLNILMQVAITMKINRLVAPHFKTTVQTLVGMVQTVASLLISSLLGGILADLVGLRPLFLMSGTLSLLTGFLFHSFVFKKDLSDEEAPIAKAAQL